MEKLLRAQAGRLQTIYDQMPSPVRSMMTSCRGWVLTRYRYSPSMYKLLAELREHEQWTAEQVRACQLSKLKAALDHARRTVPFYAPYPALEWRSLDEIQSLPVLSRETVRANAESLISTAVPAKDRIRVGTTGTTGANLKVTYSTDVAREIWAFMMRQWLWAGVEPREPRITYFGSRVVPPQRTRPPYWTHNVLERQTLASVFHLSADAAGDHIAYLRRRQGVVLEGFPSVLGILADFVLATGEPIPMRVVFTSGEPVYPFLREKIEKAFQAKIFDLYGMTEYCGMIQECEQGRMHLSPEYGYLEILDENDRPLPAGREGFMVWTAFVNTAMPLIRYRIGDRGMWQTGGPCPCGRNFPVVVPTITRDSDLLRCPDGRIFSPRALNQSLKNTTAFRFCQFVSEGPGKVNIRVVPGNDQAASELAGVQEQLRRILGDGMEVSVGLAQEPITRSGGKIPLIVQSYASTR